VAQLSSEVSNICRVDVLSRTEQRGPRHVSGLERPERPVTTFLVWPSEMIDNRLVKRGLK
jgi:hypothetical protein